MNKLIVAVVILACIAVAGIGAYFLMGPGPEGDWVKESGIRVSDGVSSCTIILSDNTYRMYYTGMSGILSAVSSDGLTWTKESGARVEPGANPAIIMLDNGSYRMIYNVWEGEFPGDPMWFVSAISTDGLTWGKESGIRLDGGESPDYGAISVPDIIKLPDGRYRMYYVGDMYAKGPEENQNSIRCAVSSDNGWTWERETISGIPAQCMDPDVIVLSDGTYRMFYSVSLPYQEEEGGIYSAISSDGLTWTKEEGARLGPGRISDPDVVELPDGTYRMYYSEQSEEPEGMGINVLSARPP